ncbi:hypothetical protein BH11PLA2_BH11PLA2_09060 [soil metagenome]
MRTLIMLLLFTTITSAAEPVDPLRLKARAALALALTDTPTYETQYAKALAAKKPLVVFVGQPVLHLGDCVCIRCESFPNVTGPAVIIGLANGNTLSRSDLTGIPTADELKAAVRQVPTVLTPLLGTLR